METPCCEGEEEGVCDEGGGGEDEEETQLGSPGAKVLLPLKITLNQTKSFKTNAHPWECLANHILFHPELLINCLSWQIGGGGQRRRS